ncbi:guanylate kinase [Candidatus Babeliales bacterium]|nr:guanylate kinase [Candidatus Babeliales bacterium]
MNKSLLIIISGPSGVGKTGIANDSITRLSPIFPIEKIVTYTTREPRTDETDGIDYFFVTEEKFKNLLESNFFFEHTEYNKNLYGTPNDFKEKLAAGISCIAVTDYTVGQHIKQGFPLAVLLWIQPPSLKILQKRLENRKTDSLEKIYNRMQIAKKELADEHEHNYFDYHIINDNFQECMKEIKKIVLSKRKK